MRAIWNSTVLTNALNANFADWEKYAAEWNIVKENRANSHKRERKTRYYKATFMIVCRTL